MCGVSEMVSFVFVVFVVLWFCGFGEMDVSRHQGFTAEVIVWLSGAFFHGFPFSLI